MPAAGSSSGRSLSPFVRQGYPNDERTRRELQINSEEWDKIVEVLEECANIQGYPEDKAFQKIGDIEQNIVLETIHKLDEAEFFKKDLTRVTKVNGVCRIFHFHREAKYGKKTNRKSKTPGKKEKAEVKSKGSSETKSTSSIHPEYKTNATQELAKEVSRNHSAYRLQFKDGDAGGTPTVVLQAHGVRAMAIRTIPVGYDAFAYNPSYVEIEDIVTASGSSTHVRDLKDLPFDAFRRFIYEDANAGYDPKTHNITCKDSDGNMVMLNGDVTWSRALREMREAGKSVLIVNLLTKASCE